jgi:iron complex outermembrane receptor protein
VSKQYNNDENLDKEDHVFGSYDPYFVADADVSFDVTKWAKLYFSVDNIFDEDYFTYYKAPGRTFFGGLTLRF